MQTINFVIQIVLAACTLLGMLAGLFRVLRKIDQLSDLPETVARLERNMDDLKRWQREHSEHDHPRRRWP